MSCDSCELCAEQPPNWEHVSLDGVFIKQMYLKEAGTVVPQHSHAYDHTSMLAVGSIKVWADDEYMGEFKAPHPIFIRAKVKHTFQVLEPNTLIYCIHHARNGTAEIHEEHQLPNKVFWLKNG